MGLLSWLFGDKQKEAVTPIYLRGPNTFSAEVGGESHYQENLKKICGNYTGHGACVEIEARLIHDDQNPYDNQAISIEINTLTVGHLSRPDARYFRKRMAENGKNGKTAACKGMIRGGWMRDEDDIGFFGVSLDLPHEYIAALSADTISDASESHNENTEINTEGVFKFYIEKLDKNNLPDSRLGQFVNLWKPHDEPLRFQIYLGGKYGRIGFLPLQYSKAIISHMDKNLPVELIVVSLDDAKCQVEGKLVSNNEVKRREERREENERAERLNEKQKLKTELKKRYNPRSPFKFYIDLKNNHKVTIGEKLQFEFHPVDFYLDKGLSLYVKSSSGKTIAVKTDEKKTIVLRILKAHFNGYLVDVEVYSLTEIDKRYDWYVAPVKVIASPHKKKCFRDSTISDSIELGSEEFSEIFRDVLQIISFVRPSIFNRQESYNLKDVHHYSQRRKNNELIPLH